jgi:hypothetical protein
MPALSGLGLLRVELSGRPSAPGVQAEGHFETLGVGPLSARALDVTLKLLDVTRPLDATLALAAGSLALSGRTFEDVHLHLATLARALELTLLASPGVQLRLAGTADADSRGLLLDTLSLSFAEETWSLKAPAALRFDGRRLETQRLELDSAGQSIALTGGTASGRVQASLEVSHLDLAHLPAVLVPASSRLSGILDATASVHGPQRHPDANLVASLANGGFHGLAEVGATI